MKTYFRPVYTVLVLFIVAISISGCEDDNKESEQDKVRALLTQGGSWNLESANVDDSDQTGDYDGFTITFTPTGYTATNGGVVWPGSGTWEFEQQNSRSIVRGDGIVVNISAISDNTLVIDLRWEENTFGQGRIKSIAGQHEFFFKRL